MQYRREIDGLRAVAVVPVILFHAGFNAFGGGYVGVDVFFVISGYLITSLLITEIAAGTFSLGRFYERRARRILPALCVVMAACLPLAWILLLPNRLQDFWQSLIAVVFFASNVLFWREFGYFAPEGKEKPLLHTWSLSVEEQFYLLFPLFLLVLWRFGRHRLFWIIAGLAAASLLLSEWGWRNASAANFFLAPTRAWELLAGSICAFLLHGRAQKSSDLLSGIGLALILGAVVLFSEHTPTPSLYTALPVGGAALIVLFAGPRTLVGRGLSQPVPVGIGLVSYSAYLWHQPLFSFARIAGVARDGGWTMAGLCVLTFVLAVATWWFVEQPFRRREQPWLATRRGVLMAGVSAAAVFLAVGVAGQYTQGLSHRLSATERAVMQYANYPAPALYQTQGCMLLSEQVSADFAETCWRDARAILIGDSHAGAFATGIAADRRIGHLSQTSCPPVLDFAVFRQPHCAEVNDFRFAKILGPGVQTAYIHADWFQYWDLRMFQEKFAETVQLLTRAGVEVVVIGGVPKFYPNLPEVILRQKPDLVAGAAVRTDLRDLRRINDGLRQLAQRAGARFWDPIARLCAAEECLAVVPLQAGDFAPLDVALMAFDHGHMTTSGAMQAADLFFADLPQ